MIGGGIGFVDGINVIIIILGRRNLKWMFRVVEEYFMNLGFLVKGNVFNDVSLVD